MKYHLRKTISVMLVGIMLFTAVPALAVSEVNAADRPAAGISEEVQGVNPAFLNNVIKSFVDAANVFASDASELTKLQTVLSRFGGVTSLAGGVIGILQMTGVLKDPTMAKLDQIIDKITSMEDKLNEMDSKLDQINSELMKIEVSQEEHERNSKARAMLQNWRAFYRDYCEPLEEDLETYHGMINRGIREWWMNKSHGSVRVIYNKAGELTFSNNKYEAGFPSKADNEEVVDKNLSFGVPAEFIPDTSSMSFSINNYDTSFKSKMAASFISAADSGKLDANDKFYENWNSLSSAEKTEKAGNYAINILDTLIYHITNDVMSTDEADKWVIQVRTHYTQYCSHILESESGVDAMIESMYLTHGFEGEIKESIKEFCDSMVVNAGFYGQFVMSCVCQDSLQSLAKREELAQCYGDTVLKLADRKKAALTGHDNFCYITGAIMKLATAKATSTISVKCYQCKYYDEYDKTDWNLTLPCIMDNVKAQMLYRQYQKLNQGCSSFTDYLHKYGTGVPSGYKYELLTNYIGQNTFGLDDGVSMKCVNQASGDYFKQDEYYSINVGNSSKIENQYFHVHDKIRYDVMDLSSGKILYNQQSGRALYAENHHRWYVDEVHVFHTKRDNDLMDYDLSINYKWRFYDFTKQFKFLKMTPREINMKSDGDSVDPLLQFDEIFYDQYSNRPESGGDGTTSITDITLKKGAYIYTGDTIKPSKSSIIVKAGKKTVPKKYYTISYSDNKEVGYGKVIVTANGDYSGELCRTFKIVPKGTAFSKLIAKKTGAKIKWKKQSARMPEEQISGYQIRYSSRSSMKGAKKLSVKDHKTASAKIRGLKKNTKYYFQIRTYVKDDRGNVYSKWSSKKTVKTRG